MTPERPRSGDPEAEFDPEPVRYLDCDSDRAAGPNAAPTVTTVDAVTAAPAVTYRAWL